MFVNPVTVTGKLTTVFGGEDTVAAVVTGAGLVIFTKSEGEMVPDPQELVAETFTFPELADEE